MFKGRATQWEGVEGRSMATGMGLLELDHS
jgi:hypothetical protein